MINSLKINVLLKLIDYAKGTNVCSWYKFFKKTTTWSVEEIDQYRVKRLKALLTHAKNSVPYYREILKDYDFTNLKSVDFLQNLPIIDRGVIQNNQSKLISKHFTLSKLTKGSSSGTTGVPISYYMDKNALSAGIAANYTLWNMSGWNPGQRNVHIWGNQTSIKRWNKISSRLKNFFFNQKNIASVMLDDSILISEVSDEIIKYNPTSIEGYPSAIYTLAKYIQSKKLNIKGLKQVFTTAENLQVYQKELIEKTLAPTGDLYGAGEVLGIATRPLNDNKYYVLDTHVIVEVAESGIEGMKEILVTDLDNYAMPLIRYKIGDMIDSVHKPLSNSNYPFFWFERLLGRNSDFIELKNGKKFHPVNIFGGTLFRQFPEITRHKVIWNGRELTFLFEALHQDNKSKLNQLLLALLKEYDVSFKIKYVDKLMPSANGKFKYIEILV